MFPGTQGCCPDRKTSSNLNKCGRRQVRHYLIQHTISLAMINYINAKTEFLLGVFKHWNTSKPSASIISFQRCEIPSVWSQQESTTLWVSFKATRLSFWQVLHTVNSIRMDFLIFEMLICFTPVSVSRSWQSWRWVTAQPPSKVISLCCRSTSLPILKENQHRSLLS